MSLSAKTDYSHEKAKLVALKLGIRGDNDSWKACQLGLDSNDPSTIAETSGSAVNASWCTVKGEDDSLSLRPPISWLHIFNCFFSWFHASKLGPTKSTMRFSATCLEMLSYSVLVSGEAIEG